MFRTAAGWVKQVQPSAIGPDPHLTLARRDDGKDDIAAQAVRIHRGMMVVGEGVLAAVVHIEAAVARANPQVPAAVLVDGFDRVRAQAGWVTRVIPVMDEHPGLRIESVQAVPRTHP